MTSRAVAKRERAMMTIYIIGTASGGGPIVPGPLITVGPVIIMLGELIKIELGKSVIELAPHMSVIDAVAVRVSVAMTVTLRFISTVRESFIITVTERFCWIVSVWLLST